MVWMKAFSWVPADVILSTKCVSCTIQIGACIQSNIMFQTVHTVETVATSFLGHGNV